MIGQLIALLFLARDLTHREHLRVTGPGSYAKHMALGEFYPAIVELADKLAEAYQGQSGIIEDLPLLDNEYGGEIVAVLDMHVKWIKANRYLEIPRDDSPLQNIIDEIVGQYLSTLYKLKYLQ
jgi:hypothetical protein